MPKSSSSATRPSFSSSTTRYGSARPAIRSQYTSNEYGPPSGGSISNQSASRSRSNRPLSTTGSVSFCGAFGSSFGFC